MSRKFYVIYFPAFLSAVLIIGHLAGYFLFYKAKVGLFTILAVPPMFWFSVAWAVGLAQLAYGFWLALKSKVSPKPYVISGAITFALFVAYLGLGQYGIYFTV